MSILSWIICWRWRRCALAVSQGNTRTATDYLAELRSRISPHGDYMQRMGHYFLEALVSRISKLWLCRRKSEDISFELASSIVLSNNTVHAYYSTV